MRISSSSINMSSTSELIQNLNKTEYTNFWVDDNQTGNALNSSSDNNSNDSGVILDLSDNAKSFIKVVNSYAKEDDKYLLSVSDKDRQKAKALEVLLEALTGKKIKIRIPEKVTLVGNNENAKGLSTNDNTVVNVPKKQGWGMTYDMSETYSESQTMNFNAEGVVKTSDGREINLSLNLNVSRQFVSQKEIHIRAGDAKMDPLVINFDGGMPELTDKKFSFDLDNDGQSEQISSLTSGNGFLSLDLNEDGVINNGTELFGPQTNDGFAELSQYDSDGNGWIDESDPIFDKLRIWTKDETGNDVLFALGQKGIGAIYLGNIASAFDFKNSSNELQGSATQSGIFLKEDGKAGVIQHIDLAV